MSQKLFSFVKNCKNKEQKKKMEVYRLNIRGILDNYTGIVSSKGFSYSLVELSYCGTGYNFCSFIQGFVCKPCCTQNDQNSINRVLDIPSAVGLS